MKFNSHPLLKFNSFNLVTNPFLSSNLLPSVPQLLFQLFVSFHCQTGSIKAQARLMRFGAANRNLSSFAHCRLWSWGSFWILLRNLWGAETSLSLFDCCLFCLVRRLQSLLYSAWAVSNPHFLLCCSSGWFPADFLGWLLIQSVLGSLFGSLFHLLGWSCSGDISPLLVGFSPVELWWHVKYVL